MSSWHRPRNKVSPLAADKAFQTFLTAIGAGGFRVPLGSSGARHLGYRHCFVLVFLAELPDKTAIASLVLSTRFQWRWVFAGIAAAFATHVLIAVTAGSLLTLLPRRLVELVVVVLFVVGAVLVWREGLDVDEEEQQEEGKIKGISGQVSFAKVASLGYVVIFVAEWGDLTQILTINLAAKYHNPVSVGIGAVLGLWSVGLIAVLGGKTLLKVLPLKWITRVTALIMVVLAMYGIVELVRG